MSRQNLVTRAWFFAAVKREWRRILPAGEHSPDRYYRDDNARDVAERAVLVLKITAVDDKSRVGLSAVEKHHCGPQYGYFTGVTQLAIALLNPIV
jgi:hypothetical protein